MGMAQVGKRIRLNIRELFVDGLDMSLGDAIARSESVVITNS